MQKSQDSRPDQRKMESISHIMAACDHQRSFLNRRTCYRSWYFHIVQVKFVDFVNNWERMLAINPDLPTCFIFCRAVQIHVCGSPIRDAIDAIIAQGREGCPVWKFAIRCFRFAIIPHFEIQFQFWKWLNDGSGLKYISTEQQNPQKHICWILDNHRLNIQHHLDHKSRF